MWKWLPWQDPQTLFTMGAHTDDECCITLVCTHANTHRWLHLDCNIFAEVALGVSCLENLSHASLSNNL